MRPGCAWCFVEELIYVLDLEERVYLWYREGQRALGLALQQNPVFCLALSIVTPRKNPSLEDMGQPSWETFISADVKPRHRDLNGRKSDEPLANFMADLTPCDCVLEALPSPAFPLCLYSKGSTSCQ